MSKTVRVTCKTKSAEVLFSERLKYTLACKGIKQVWLAEKLGVHKVTVSRFVNGQRTPNYDTMRRIARCLGVSTDFLLGNEKELRVNYELED